MNSREVAYLALLFDGFLDDYFVGIQHEGDTRDLKLAKEIAYGTLKRELSCEYIASKLGKIKLKRKEKLLLYTAIYQFYFTKKIPSYAILDETIKLCKKYLFKKNKFFTAILHKMIREKISLPTSSKIKDLSCFYSYPKFFVKKLIEDIGEDKTKKVLEAGNRYLSPTIRARTDTSLDLEKVYDGKFVVYKTDDLTPFIGSVDYYIQSGSFVYFIEKLTENIKNPKKILDLCASPGGKSILLFDIFKKAQLYVNDISKKRIELLKKNLKTYGVDAKIFCEDGKTQFIDEKFDIVLIDAPCSNSAVLSKRAEARWRLEEENIKTLQQKQLALIRSGEKFLKKEGKLFYITCSILRKENEEVIKKIEREGKLRCLESYKILPDNTKDGGFAALFELI